MKIIGKAILLSVLVAGLASCNTFAPKPTEVPTPTSIPFTNTPEPTVTLTATATALSPKPTATEAPVNLKAPYKDYAIPTKDIANALAQSEDDGKLVLLEFGANWCVDCLVLAELLEDPTVKPFLKENFHVVRIDVGNWNRNLDISEKYGNPIDNGIPAVVVLAPSGEIIATTKNGSLAKASTATAQEILALLQTWLAKKPQ